MRARPILFSGPMVRAIIDGRKTQTRRVVKGLPAGCDLVEPLDGYPGEFRWWRNGEAQTSIACPYGIPGDRLWVRETFLTRAAGEIYCFRADAIDEIEAAGFGAMYGGWKPAIFLPRAHSRLTLEVTEVRVQRLQQISEEDAKAEGMLFNGTYYQGGPHDVSGSKVFSLATQAFRDLWDSINAKRHPWASNPWVWAVEFKKGQS